MALPMEGKKNLCAMISTDLHRKIMAEKEQLELNTLAEYVERIFTEHFEGGQISMKAERTLAVQIPAELFERLKEYLAARNLKQKQFLIQLIENALAERQGGVGAVKAVAQTAEPCDSHTDKENHDGAAHNLHQRGMGIFKLIFTHRNIGGDTHDEHKEREHKVGRSQTQPTCMLKRSIDCAP